VARSRIPRHRRRLRPHITRVPHRSPLCSPVTRPQGAAMSVVAALILGAGIVIVTIAPRSLRLGDRRVGPSSVFFSHRAVYSSKARACDAAARCSGCRRWFRVSRLLVRLLLRAFGLPLVAVCLRAHVRGIGREGGVPHPYLSLGHRPTRSCQSPPTNLSSYIG